MSCQGYLKCVSFFVESCGAMKIVAIKTQIPNRFISVDPTLLAQEQLMTFREAEKERDKKKLADD